MTPLLRSATPLVIVLLCDNGSVAEQLPSDGEEFETWKKPDTDTLGCCQRNPSYYPAFWCIMYVCSARPFASKAYSSPSRFPSTTYRIVPYSNTYHISPAAAQPLVRRLLKPSRYHRRRTKKSPGVCTHDRHRVLCEQWLLVLRSAALLPGWRT